MFVKKTGLRLKQYISHQINDRLDPAVDVLPGQRLLDKFPRNTLLRLSWLSRRGVQTSAEKTACITDLLPVGVKARSSISSLCSCASTRPLSRSGQGLGASQCLCASPLCPKIVSGDELLIPDDELSITPSTFQRTSQCTPEATFDLLEALAMDPTDMNLMPWLAFETPNLFIMDKSHDIKRMTREMDEAFRPRQNSSASTSTVATRKSWLGSAASSKSTTKQMPRKAIIPAPDDTPSSISRTRTVNKVSRKQRLLRKIPTSWAPGGFATTIVGNVRDSLSSTEAQEISTFSNALELADTQVGTDLSAFAELPCYNESGNEALYVELPAISISPDDSRPSSRQSISCQREDDTIFELEALQPPNVEMTFNRLRFPSPPQNTPTVRKDIPHCPEIEMDFDNLRPPYPQQNVPSGRLHGSSVLPAIPEAPHLECCPSEPIPRIAEPSHNFGLSSSTCITLQSTPYTANAPLYRHGPIVIEHLRAMHRKVMREDSLDWTAFQMAILGTMEQLEEPEDGLNDDINDIDDDLVEWWEGFNLGPVGGLVGEPPLSIPVPQERDWREVLEEQMQQSQPQEIEQRESISKSEEMRTPRQSSASWLSAFSEAVPMGFNLERDLGDFLSWQMQHSYHRPKDLEDISADTISRGAAELYSPVSPFSPYSSW